MTTDPATLPAGRELDQLVAERVMGLEKRAADPSVPELEAEPKFWIAGRGYQSPPCYSTSISAVWLVIDRLNELGFGISVDSYPNGGSLVSVLKKQDDDCWSAVALVRGDTVPLAIVRAALAAVSAKSS